LIRTKNRWWKLKLEFKQTLLGDRLVILVEGVSMHWELMAITGDTLNLLQVDDAPRNVKPLGRKIEVITTAPSSVVTSTIQVKSITKVVRKYSWMLVDPLSWETLYYKDQAKSRVIHMPRR
jgi:hypothetical protein